MCRADPPLRQVCCFPGAQVKDITRKLPSLVRPSDCYPLLPFRVGGDEATACCPTVIKRDFRALGWLVRERRARVIFSSLLPVVGSNIRRNRCTQSTNTWLRAWCHGRNLGFFDNGRAYMAPGLLVTDGIHLSQSRKSVFAHKLVGLIGRALN